MFRQDLEDLSIFKGYGPQQLKVMSRLFEPVNYSANTEIFKQGQFADYLYIMCSGKVIIRFKPYDGPPLTVATIQPGEVFGWSAALGRPSYTSGALTLDAGEFFRVSAERLKCLCQKNPELGADLLERLAKAVNERLQQTHNELLNILKEGIDRNGVPARSENPCLSKV